VLLAQKTAIYTHDGVVYNSALELYDKEKFSAAQEKFATFLKNTLDNKSELAVNAKYYHAVCGLELFNKDAEGLLVEFINAYPESPKVKLAYYQLGRYQFRKKKYKKALDWFDKIDAYDLSNDELSEYYFKRGYCFFMEKKFDKASKAFFEIKDADTKYTAPARYYYAHIAYLKKNYESALQTFQSLSSNAKFSPIIPYYITQIYYLQKKYDLLIEYAPALLDTAVPKRIPEISRLIGEAYYHTNKFNEAIPYLNRYNKSKGYAAPRSDQYQLGFAYFKSDSCDKAIEWFKMAVAEKDSISQAAHYHLAECYLKTNQQKYAQRSFRAASKMKFDAQIKEDALFSYAKISYELSLHPYNDAILAFEEYINTYPNSKKLSNAYEYLVAVYYTTKNYKAALNSLENIKVLGTQLEEAYQKIAHYRGLELFNNRKYEEAISHFNKSDKYLLNGEVKALNVFWRAEANYRLANYEKAIGGYKSFVIEPGAVTTAYLNKANYNVGYSYFKLKEYANAKGWLRKYVQGAETEKTKTKNDALNRVADCFFIEKDYKAAIEYYDKASMLGLYKSDYSLYQSAIANGVIGNYVDKVSLLETLISKNEKTHLLDDAFFELGKTQLIQNKNNEALTNFNHLNSNFPNSPYLSKSLVKVGLIHFNNKEDKEALTAFKRVVADYNGTEEAKESLAKIKKIYIDKGELGVYENYLATIGGADSSAMILDADYYEVAENSYISGDCEKATAELAKYLEKYPTGIYVLNAHYYKADCEAKSGFDNEALIDFNYVIDQPKNKFTENSLVKAAQINRNLGKLVEALNHYSKLEYLADNQENVFKAQVAQMHLNYELKNHESTIKYCELIINKDVDNALLITEAHLLYAKTAMEKDDYNKALTEFTTASTSANKFGAEAKYNVAYILHLRGEHDNCEAEVFSLIKKFGSYDYWIGKSLVLLADNYLAKDDMFQAKVTLQNVIDNAKYPELVTIALEKLQGIETQEAAMRVAPEVEEINIPLMDVNELEKLFGEEDVEDEELPEAPINKEGKVDEVNDIEEIEKPIEEEQEENE